MVLHALDASLARELANPLLRIPDRWINGQDVMHIDVVDPAVNQHQSDVRRIDRRRVIGIGQRMVCEIVCGDRELRDYRRIAYGYFAGQRWRGVV